MNQIEIYKAQDGKTQIEVKFEKETVWLNQAQLMELFLSSKANISEHISNIFESAELNAEATVRKFRTVRKEGNRTINRNIEHYNLDVIISIGYRVNSKRGIQFRQWATQRLKDYLVQGYAINQKRLEQLQQVVNIIQQTGSAKELSATETKGLLDIITHYTQSFILLNRFDSNKLGDEQLDENITYEIEYNDAISAIGELKKQLIKKKEASDLFGKQKDKSFAGMLKTVVQTFNKKYLYPSIEEQAAHLLYFVIKNHPFTDGTNGSAPFCLFGSWKRTNTVLKNQES